MKHYPSSIVSRSIAKRLTTVYLAGGRKRSSLSFHHYAGFSSRCPIGIKGGGSGGWWWWQISIDGPACPSVCYQKAEFICVIQALMLSCPRLGLCVAQQREGLACTYGQHTAPAARNKQIPNRWTVAERVELCV